MEWVAAAIAGIGVISSIIGGNKARSDAKDAAAREAAAEEKVTAEKLRQLFREEDVMRGQTLAAVAGSGVRTDRGSPLKVLAEQQAEFIRERLITKQVGATRAQAALAQGSAIGRQAKYQGYSQAASGLTNLFTILANRNPGTT